MKLIINGEMFRFFSKYDISLKYNAVASSFSFSGLQDFFAKYLNYPKVQIYNDDDELLITGTIVNQPNTIEAKPSLIDFSGYSLPGVLEDCNIAAFPLQSDNLSLIQIIEKNLEPFGIEYEITDNVRNDANKIYKKSTAKIDQTPKSYIDELASQRNIMLSCTPEGKLLFTRLDVDSLPVVEKFEEDGFGSLRFGFSVNGQAMHSEITVLREASSDNPDAGEFTINNPYVSIFRPKTKILSSGDLFDVESAAIRELKNEISNIKLIIQTTKFVRPGNIIQAKSNTLGFGEFVDFFVDQTDISGSESGVTYSLSCVLKDAYSENKEIKNIFL